MKVVFQLLAKFFSGEILMSNCLEIYTQYRCRYCGQKVTLKTNVHHTNNFNYAREFALVVNDDNPLLKKFEQLHNDHIYTHDLKLVPTGRLELS